MLIRRTGPSVRAKIILVVPLLVLAAAGGSAQTASKADTAELLVGVFELARYRAHGEHPIGRISYDRAGRMWAMLLPPGRPLLDGTSTTEDYRAAMRGLIAYYGTYELDEENGTVVHHVEAASNPAWIGQDFVRWYRFEDGDLWISLNPEFENPLVWTRLPPG